MCLHRCASWVRRTGFLAAAFIWRAACAADCDPAAISPTGAADRLRGTPEAYDWEGEYQETQVCYPSRQSRAQLAAYLYAPKNLEQLAGPLPIVVIGPGSGTGRAYNYLWSARELASHGYLALVGDPQGSGSSEIVGDPSLCTAQGCPGVPWQQASNYVDGLESALDFVFSRDHPWLQNADLAHVGLAGHSLSARAASYVQGADARVGAVVAWDNLVSLLEGDAGASSGGGTCGDLIDGEVPGGARTPVTPRVPVLGEASDAAPSCMPTNGDPEVKKTGYLFFRDAGMTAMEVVFKGATHFDWAQTSSTDPAQLQQFQYYTRAWFDLYLKGDEAARERLLRRDPLGDPLDQVLSGQFHSAAFMPEIGFDCEDLLAGCEPPASPGHGSAGERFGGAFGPDLLAGLASLLLLQRRRRADG